MKKRIISALLCLALLLAALPLIVLAAENAPGGYTAVYTEADLKNIGNNMSGRYILMADITLTENWKALGYTSSTSYTKFTGIIDGNGHTISGYKAAGNSFVYYNQGTIKNLTISGTSTYGGTQGIFCVSNEGLIQNCHNKVSINSTVYTNAMTYTGGIVLHNRAGGVVELCSNQAELNVTVSPYSGLSDKGIRVGGIAGHNSGTIRKCWNTGNINVTGKSGTSGYAAGIVGYGENNSVIENCYNSGTLYAKQDFSSSFSYNYGAAGIMCSTYDKYVKVTITNCYNAGSCSVYAPYSSKYVGGITGFAPGTQYTNCYFLEGTAANGSYSSTPKNVTKLTSSQMTSQSSFAGFDFNNVWQMGSGSYRYPVLRAGCTHSVDKVAAKEATCTADGNIEHWYCSLCGKYYNNSSKSKELSRSEVVIPGGHAYESVVTPPTCTEGGYTTHTCANCDDTYTDSETESTGHSYESVVTPNTCTEDGYTTHTCSKCGDTYTDSETESTGHSYESVVTPNTCTEDGYTTHTCSGCGDTYTDTETESTGHSYESVVTPPTCTVGGYTTYTCHCGDTYTDDETEATGHDHEAVVTPPTCTEGGYTTYTCHCGDTYTDDETEATGHDHEAVVTPPTCTEGGYTTYTCACGDTYTDDETEATGHSHEAVVTPPTCTEGGYTTYTCSCGDTYTGDETEATGHNHEAVVTPPTCTEDGYTTHTCSDCGDTYKDTETESTGHDYEAVVTPPTCTEDGYTTHTCSDCGDTYTDSTVEETGHSYESVVTPPTCDKGGYTTYTCSECGDTYIDDETDSLAHADKNDDGLCDGCEKDIRNDITITQPSGGKVTISDTTPETGDKVTITVTPNAGKETDGVTVTDKAGNKITLKDNGDGTYTFTQPEGDLTVTVTFKDKRPVETTPAPPTDGSPETGEKTLLPVVLLMMASLAAVIALLGIKKRRTF